VVFLRKDLDGGGRRVVTEVLEVTGSSDGRVTRSRIFAEGPDGRAVRDPEIAIMRGTLLTAKGYQDDVGWPTLPAPPTRTGPGTSHRTGTSNRSGTSNGTTDNGWVRPAPPGWGSQ